MADRKRHNFRIERAGARRPMSRIRRRAMDAIRDIAQPPVRQGGLLSKARRSNCTRASRSFSTVGATRPPRALEGIDRCVPALRGVFRRSAIVSSLTSTRTGAGRSIPIWIYSPKPYGPKAAIPMSRHLQAKEARVALGADRKVAVRSLPRPAESARHVPVMSTAPDASHDSSAKATLASKLNELLDENGLSQSAAAQLLGMPQPKVSAIRNYKLHGISLERLMQALLALNQQVEITVKPGRKSACGSIRVAV